MAVMIIRVLFLVALLCTYLSVRMAIYHWFIPYVDGSTRHAYAYEPMDKAFSYLVAVPVTGLVMFAAIGTVAFVTWGVP